MPSLHGFETTDPTLMAAIRQYAPTVLSFYGKPDRTYKLGTRGDDLPAGSILQEWTDGRVLRRFMKSDFEKHAPKHYPDAGPLAAGVRGMYARVAQHMQEAVAHARWTMEPMRRPYYFDGPRALYQGRELAAWAAMYEKPMKLKDLEMQILMTLQDWRKGQTKEAKARVQEVRRERHYAKKYRQHNNHSRGHQDKVETSIRNHVFDFKVSGWHDYYNSNWGRFKRWSDDTEAKEKEIVAEITQLTGLRPEGARCFYPTKTTEEDSYAELWDLDDDSEQGVDVVGWNAMTEEQRLNVKLNEDWNSEELEAQFSLPGDRGDEDKLYVGDILYLWKVGEVFEIHKDDDFKMWVRALIRLHNVNMNRRFWRKFVVPGVLQIDVD